MQMRAQQAPSAVNVSNDYDQPKSKHRDALLVKILLPCKAAMCETAQFAHPYKASIRDSSAGSAKTNQRPSRHPAQYQTNVRRRRPRDTRRVASACFAHECSIACNHLIQRPCRLHHHWGHQSWRHATNEHNNETHTQKDTPHTRKLPMHKTMVVVHDSTLRM